MYSLDSSNRDMFFMYVLIFAVIFPSTFFTIFQCCMDSCDLHPGGSCFKTSQISFSCWNFQLQNVISLPRRFHPSPTKKKVLKILFSGSRLNVYFSDMDVGYEYWVGRGPPPQLIESLTIWDKSQVDSRRHKLKQYHGLYSKFWGSPRGLNIG